MPVYKDSRRGTFFYSFSVNGKRIRSKDFATKQEANRELSKAVLSTEYGSSNKMTFSQVSSVFLAEKKPRLKPQSYDRLETMLQHMLDTIGSVQVEKLTINQYRKALEHLDNYTFHGKPLKNSYKNKVIRTFKQLCSFARKRYDLYTNIPDKFEPYKNEEKEEMKFITLDQFNQLLSVVDDEVYRGIFLTLFYMGLRIGELNALQFGDIDFENNTMTIRKTVTTKKKSADGQFLITSPKTKNSARTLPMPQIVSNALFQIMNKYSTSAETSPQSFVFGLHKPIPESTIQKRKKQYFEDAGLEEIRLHDFRHSCASFLINNKATPLLVSRWLGHSNVSMTLNTYSHLWKSELDEIVKLIDVYAKRTQEQNEK